MLVNKIKNKVIHICFIQHLNKLEIKVQSLSPTETCRHLTPKDQNEISYQLTLVDFSLSVDFSGLLFHLH